VKADRKVVGVAVMEGVGELVAANDAGDCKGTEMLGQKAGVGSCDFLH
jgi:hypothetical protein